MALTAEQAYALAKGYTDTTVAGGGAIKGKNCVITSIEAITGGHRVNFQWTLDNGTVQTDYIDVTDGVDGKDGKDGSNVVEVTQVISTGTKIATINVDGTDTDLYAPTGGSTVAVTPTITEGTKVAEIEVGGATSEIFSTDEWSAVAIVDSNSQVTFTGLSDYRAYTLYVENKLATVTNVTKTGSGLHVTLTYTLSGVLAGDRCKLRIVGGTIEHTSRLPDEYYEVEYLQSTGTQYINTGLATPNGFRITCTVRFDSYNTDQNDAIFGAVNRHNPECYSVIESVINTHHWIVGSGAWYESSEATQLGTLYSIEANTLGSGTPSLTVNEDSMTMAQTYAGSGRTDYINYLFARNDSLTLDILRGRIYGDFKVYTSADDSQLVAHFIPCVRKSDGVAGMYDIVRNNFYTNVGSGTFGVGAPV